VTAPNTIRLGLDIGGTFTDVALEAGGRRVTAKTLTTSGAPEDGVLAALRSGKCPRPRKQPPARLKAR
jgi:N-methylhydantoinase A